MGSKHTRTMLNFAYTLCSSAMFVSDVLGVGYGQVFCVQCLFVLRVARKHGLVQARGPRVTVVFLTLAVLAQGGGGYHASVFSTGTDPGQPYGAHDGGVTALRPAALM